MKRFRSPHAAGFTLTEVLIALGILAVGITSVASLFPPAILMQQETVRDILGQQNLRSLDAVLQAKSVDGAQLFRFSDNLLAATEDRANPGDIRFDNINGAAAARGLWLTGTPVPPTQERFVVPDAAFDVFALAEVDAYTPRLDSTATRVVGPSSGGWPFGPGTLPAGTAVANYQFPDMRVSTNFGGDNTYAEAQSMLAAWGDVDRAFPTYIARPDDRELYVVPLVQRGLFASDFSSDWRPTACFSSDVSLI
jgi:prepilin-type N-terminal cleavage/methylation domain-containing protein